MVQEKDSPLRSSLLETERWTIFYCNSCKAILNPQRTRETQFLRKLFARPAFSRKSGQYCVAIRCYSLVRGLSAVEVLMHEREHLIFIVGDICAEGFVVIAFESLDNSVDHCRAEDIMFLECCSLLFEAYG